MAKRTKTPSFIAELKLCTSEYDEHVLDHRFFVNNLMKNRLIRHARKAVASLRQDTGYRQLLHERMELKNKAVKKRDKALAKQLRDLDSQLSAIRTKYGVSEYQFHSWIAVQQHRYSRYIDSHAAQKTATEVYASVEKALFGNGEQIHFKKLIDSNSVEGKNNAAGIRFVKGQLHWLGLVVQPHIDKRDTYIQKALKHRVKYCRIVRKAMGIKFHYYLQLVLEGVPPKQHTVTDGVVGIDPGVSSEAVVSDKGCILTDLGNNNVKLERMKPRIQRKMERSKRAMNPNKFNPDGAIKHNKLKWKFSNIYKRDRMRLKTLFRKNKASLIQKENILANEILEKHGSAIYVEKMDYKALQKKSKLSVNKKTGRYRSRKRFGKSLGKHAPSRFLSILERKLSYADKTITYVDTWKYRASQYDHVSDTYKKIPLAQRTKQVGGCLVQRDLYSAFLLYCAHDTESPDRNKCIRLFPMFLKHQEQCITELINNNCNHSTFGLSDFAA